MLPSRGAQLPDIQVDAVPGLNSANEDASSVANNFFMYIFKVQPCPKRGAHDWSSCPYAHPKEKARRRDPRVYKYASTPCPESLKGVSCGRGVDCPFAHSVYEYWLHPSRFRTQMCKKGNQCNRTLCFFAHSACELRFPDTTDDLEAAAVDAAAASATAGALPMVTPGAQTVTYHPSSMMMGMAPNAAAVNAAVHGGSGYGLPGMMGIGGVCGDSSSMQLANAARYNIANGGSSYGLVGMPGQQQQQLQGSLQGPLQGSLVRDDAGGSFASLAGSDPNLRIPGIAMQQQQQQDAAARSLSEPLPPMPDGSTAMMNGCNPATNAAWLQLAAASQLPASQILSSIRPPQPQPPQMPQAAQQLMPGTRNAAMDAAASLAHLAAPPGMMGGLNMNMSSGGAASAGMDNVSSNLAALSLVDDSSNSSSCLTGMSGEHQYLAALNVAAAAAASGRPLDLSAALQTPLQSPPKNSSNMENFLLLQQLQAQQQQLAKLGSTASSMSCGLSPGSRQGSGNMYAALANMQNGMQNGNMMASQQINGSWGVRMA
ncbi:hypothetical protein OEZ86_005672 [Tetradesmus obliquus]|nr:hypothetical protein OEZ86_005672 [Tetradesmus obliquus]